MKNVFSGLLCAGFVAAVAGPAVTAQAADIDWSEIPSTTLTLFYPGQSTYDWLLTPEHKKGYERLAEGKACLDCHEDDEADVGDAIVAGESKADPEPPADKAGSIEVNVQAAHDGENLYLRFQWETTGDGDDKDGVAVLLDDGTVDLFEEQGCWITCHNGMRDARDAAPKEKVKSHPYLGKVLKQEFVHKYLFASRSDEKGSWDKVKSADEIAEIKNAGGFLDLMRWRASGKTEDGYVLESRLPDAGGTPKGEGALEDGVYTVVLQRKLDTGHPEDDKILEVGGEYTIGIAVHDGGVEGRHHYTAYPRILGIGTEADIEAVELP